MNPFIFVTISVRDHFKIVTNVHSSSMIGQILSMDDRTGPNNCTTGPNWFGGPRFWSEFYLVRSVVLS